MASPPDTIWKGYRNGFEAALRQGVNRAIRITSEQERQMTRNRISPSYEPQRQRRLRSAPTPVRSVAFLERTRRQYRVRTEQSD